MRKYIHIMGIMLACELVAAAGDIQKESRFEVRGGAVYQADMHMDVSGGYRATANDVEQSLRRVHVMPDWIPDSSSMLPMSPKDVETFSAAGVAVEASMKVHESQVMRMRMDGGIVSTWSRDVEQSYSSAFDADGPLQNERMLSIQSTGSDDNGSGAISLSSSLDWQAETKVDMDMNFTRQTVWLGSTFDWLISSRINLFITPKVSVNVVDMTARRMETLTIIGPDGSRQQEQVWHDEKEKSYCLPGVAVAAGMGYGVADNWNVQVALAREWVFTNPDMEVGPTKIEADLDSYNLEFTIGYEF